MREEGVKYRANPPKGDRGQYDNYVLVQGQRYGDIKHQHPDYRVSIGINPWNLARLEGWVWEALDETVKEMEAEGINVLSNEAELKKRALLKIQHYKNRCEGKAVPHKRLKTLYPYWKKGSNLSPWKR